jgi:phosphatidylglycerol:prolipoprotein diacylglycerol transferase
MHPVIARIGPLYIYSYGLMVALGFAVFVSLAYRQAEKFGINKDKVVDFGISILLGGLAGARIFYILTDLGYYIAHPAQVFDLTKGGLVWYGGFLMGLVVGLIFVRLNNINFWDGADMLAPFIPLGQAIGRIGCFLNGCCYGTPVSLNNAFGVLFPGESVLRHPTQIYESIGLLVLFLMLKKWQSARRFKGEIFLGYALSYSVLRFLIEFLRGDNPRILLGLTIGQLVSVAMFLVSAAMLGTGYILWKKSSSRSE